MTKVIATTELNTSATFTAIDNHDVHEYASEHRAINTDHWVEVVGDDTYTEAVCLTCRAIIVEDADADSVAERALAVAESDAAEQGETAPNTSKLCEFICEDDVYCERLFDDADGSEFCSEHYCGDCDYRLVGNDHTNCDRSDDPNFNPNA